MLASARAGDESAFSRLLTVYAPLISASVKRCLASDDFAVCDEDELRQEATISFYNAVVSYDPGKCDTEFGHYAKVCIERGLISHFRKQRRRAHVTASLDEVKTVFEQDDPVGRVIERENVVELNERIRASLSEYENRVWELHISGRSAAEIAELLGRDVRSISNALRRIRVKLRREIGRTHGDSGRSGQ